MDLINPPPANPEPLRTALKNRWPGGEWVLPHYEQGPFSVVVVAYEADSNSLAQACLVAYPAVRVLPTLLLDEKNVSRVSAHVVPKFVKDILFWYQEEAELELMNNLPPLTQETPHGDEELLSLMPQLLNYDPEGLFESACEALATATSAATVLTALCTAPAHIFEEMEEADVVSYLEGLLAPVIR